MTNIERNNKKRTKYIYELIAFFEKHNIELQLDSDVDTFLDSPIIRKFVEKNDYLFCEEIIRGTNKGFSSRLEYLKIKDWEKFIDKINQHSTIYIFMYIPFSHSSYHNTLVLFKVINPIKIINLFVEKNSSLVSNIPWNGNFYVYNNKDNKTIYYHYEYDGVFILK